MRIVIETRREEIGQEIRDFLQQRADRLLAGPSFTKRSERDKEAVREFMTSLLWGLEDVTFKITEDSDD